MGREGYKFYLSYFLFQGNVHGVVVFLHTGIEYQILGDESIEETAEIWRNISKYADVLIHAHAHLTTRHMFYKDMFFSGQLGNLLFPMHMTRELDGNFDFIFDI